MARKQNLTVDQGSEFLVEFDLHDELGDALDVTDYTASASFRQWFEYGTIYPFTTQLQTGKLSLTLSTTDTINTPYGRYVYEARLVNTDGSVMRIVEGLVEVTPRIP